ncbi:MAG: hypothetical protein ACLR8P_18275 [Clostridium fessum]
MLTRLFRKTGDVLRNCDVGKTYLASVSSAMSASILPVSAMMHGEYGIEDITLSMPAIVGIGGVETHVPIALSEEEAEKLVESAKKLKEVAKGLIE